LIAFGLCGLWHGAGWNYLVFGLITGLTLVVHDLFRRWCEGRPRLSAVLQTEMGTAFRIGLTFVCFSLSLIVFRCTDFGQATAIVVRMFAGASGKSMPIGTECLYLTMAVVALGHLFASRRFGPATLERVPATIRDFAMGSALVLAMVAAPGMT